MSAAASSLNNVSITDGNGSQAQEGFSLALSSGEALAILGPMHGSSETLLRTVSFSGRDAAANRDGNSSRPKRSAPVGARIATWPSSSISVSPFAPAIAQFARIIARQSGVAYQQARIEFELAIGRIAPAMSTAQFRRSPTALSAETLACGLLACAVAQKPDILFGDYPLDSIAPKAAEALLDSCLAEQKRQGFAFLFGTMTAALANRAGGRVVHFRAGRIVVDAPSLSSDARSSNGTDSQLVAGHSSRVITRAEPVLQAYALQPQGAKDSKRTALTFEIRRGGSLAFVGEPDAGPRALLRTILGIERPAGGRIVFDAVEIGILPSAMLTRLRRKLALVVGNDDVLDPRLTVWDTVAELLRAQLGLPHNMLDVYCESALRRVGLTSVGTGQLVAHLSAFDKRRLQVARAMAGAPLLAILEEPWRGLEPGGQNTMINLLRDFRKTEGPAFVVVTADFSVAQALAEEAMVFDKGRMVERGPVAELMAAPKTAATRQLLDAARGGLS